MQTPPDDVIAAAQAAQSRWGVPASVTIAQWALESAWGRHMPPESNNPFGIKAMGDQPFVLASTHEVVNGQTVVVQAKFRKFASVGEAFDAHGELLATSPRYAAARQFEADPERFAQALTGVYATATDYGSMLVTLMQVDRLEQYDLPGAEVAPAMAAAAPAAQDGACIEALCAIGENPAQLDAAQVEAARRLLAYDGEVYPKDGCAITLSVMLQTAGVDVADTFQAITLGRTLRSRGWTPVDLGKQQEGDIGSTCGDAPDHGSDHVYLVVQVLNPDEMLVADNQEKTAHFRFASGQGRTPTRFFLRVPGAF